MASTSSQPDSPKVIFSVNGTSIDMGQMMHQIMYEINNGLDEVRQQLREECDIVLECKVCRKWFRSFPNFVTHKSIECLQDETLLDQFEPSVTEEEVVVVQPEEQPSTSSVLEEQPSTSSVLEEQPSTSRVLEEQPSTSSVLEEQPSTSSVLEKEPSSTTTGPKPVRFSTRARKAWQCHVCVKTFRKSDEMLLYVKTNNSKSIFQWACPCCIKKFKNFASLAKHLKGAHNKSDVCIRDMKVKLVKQKTNGGSVSSDKSNKNECYINLKRISQTRR